MTLRRKLVANAAVTIAGILVIGAASLIGIYYVKDKIRDVTENSTPYQLKTSEFTRTLQEHAVLLYACANASGERELSGKEAELKQTLEKLKTLTSGIGSLKATPDVIEMGHMLHEVEALTQEIAQSTHERVQAESQAAISVKEVRARLNMLTENQAALQASLKELQRTVVSSLMRSTSTIRPMAQDFRNLQRIKEFFQQLQSAFIGVGGASSTNDVSVPKGRISFALQGIRNFGEGSRFLAAPLQHLEEQLSGNQGLFSLKVACIEGPPDAGAQNLFDESSKRCRVLVDSIDRLIFEKNEDATFAFYAENSQLDDQLGNSDTVHTAVLLNTEMATVMDAIAYSVQNLFAEHRERRIADMQPAIKRLFASAKDIETRMEEALPAEGGETERSLVRDAAAGLDHVEELVMKRGGLIEVLKAAAATKARSDELGVRLAGMVQAQKETGARDVSDAQGRQQQSVGAVNFVVKAATVLLLAVIALVLAVTLSLVCTIARSIMTLVEDLEAAKVGAESASREKSRFLANMSHEIRTPMNGVLGLLELLKVDALSEKQRTYVNMALSSGVALLNVINDVLDFSKIEAGRLELNIEDFDLHESVEETVSFFAEKAEAKKIELLCHILPGTPRHVLGDMARVRQILINLISNAIKFTEAGEVAVECGPAAGEDEWVTLRFVVRDTGIGVAPEARSKIFDSFSQADASTTRKFGGTGLGLSIATQLARMMGGEIGVDSSLGAGSTFWFTARLGKRPNNAEEEKPETHAPGRNRLSGLKVLVVDDNATNRRILEDMLTAWGLCPESAASGPEALSALTRAAARQLPFQLAILDMMMPGMDGIALACAIRSDAGIPRLPLIMLTSLDGKGESASCREAGFALRLVKPVRQSQLLNALGSVMGVTGAEETSPVPVKSSGLRISLSVLLVEDYAVNQTVGSAMLVHLGCSVDVADNGKMAVDLYSRKRYDLILMDCQMPEMDGYEATRAIREIEKVRTEQEPHIAIVALTAHAMEGDRERSLEAGMDDHLCKPFTLDQLREVLIKYGSPDQGAPEGATCDAEGLAVAPAAEHIIKGTISSERAGSVAIDPAALERIRQLDPDGQDGLVRTVIMHYLSEAPKTIGSLRQAVDAGDGEAVQKVAHGFKSASANVGAVSLAEFCREMELAGRTNAIEGRPEMLLSIERAYADASAALEARL